MGLLKDDIDEGLNEPEPQYKKLVYPRLDSCLISFLQCLKRNNIVPAPGPGSL